MRELRLMQREIGVLEFLYPPKTLALMTRLSKLSLECFNTYKYPPVSGSLRSYSSARKQNMAASASTTTIIKNEKKAQEMQVHIEQLGRKIEELAIETKAFNKVERSKSSRVGTYNGISIASNLLASTAALPLQLIGKKESILDQKPSPQYVVEQPLENLRIQLDGSIPLPCDAGAFETAWHLYLQLPKEQRTVELQRKLLNFMSFSTRQEEFVRSTLLCEKSEENPYWKAVLMQLRLGTLDNAVRIHDNATSTQSQAYLGSDILLAHALQRRKWTAALHIFNSRMTDIAFQGNKLRMMDSESIWNIVNRLPQILDIVSECLDHAKEKFNLNDPYSRNFLRYLVSSVLISCKQSGLAVKRDLLQKLDSLDLASSKLYEAAISGPLFDLSYRRIPRHEYPETRRLFFDIYKKYRQFSHEAPPEYLLKNMLRLLNHRNIIGKLEVQPESIEKDYHERYGHIPLKALISLLSLYARQGKAAQVHECFEKFSPRPLKKPDVIRPLLHVHARRGEAAETQRQFDRIQQEFGLQPDLACWNILLNAHVQAKDVDKARKCFSRMQNSGMNLDQYSFLPMLHLSAERGESANVIEFLEMAKSQGLELSADMFSSLVLAHIKNENLVGAEEALETLKEAKDRGDLVDPLTKSWNYVLTAYATRKDIESVLRLFKAMQLSGIPSDSATYGALIQVLCLKNNTQSAVKILQEVMPKKGIRELPFHYALVMAGYHRQDQWDEARKIYKRMLEKGITPDASTRLAYLKSLTFRILKRPEPDEEQLKELEKEVERHIEESDRADITSTGPQLGLNGIAPQNVTDAYLAALIMNYGRAGMHEMVDKIMERYRLKQNNGSGHASVPSLQILHALMFAKLKANDHQEVQRFWKQYEDQVARLLASELQTTSNKAPETRYETVSDESDANCNSVNPSILLDLKGITIPPNRRNIFSRPLLLYIPSLSIQGKFHLIYATIQSLLNQGFTFDNSAWNTYIYHLAESSTPAHIITAFRVCEEKLMPNFPGWVKVARPIKHSQRRAKFEGGFDHMKIDHNKPRWSGLLMPQFQTLLRLRAVLDRIERAEEGWNGGKETFEFDQKNGMENETGEPGDGEGDTQRLVLTVEGLGAVAPLTVRAAQTIPEVTTPTWIIPS
jgi:pentatricopeptide repeat-containing protein PET309